MISQAVKEETSIDYPKRDRFHANRLTRLLYHSCAAKQIGQDATLLVVFIAHAEDATKYRGPVRFWNSQLNEAMGFRSPKSLNNARARAVEAGWLVYSRKNDRSDGLYWTDIPTHVLRFHSEQPECIPSTESFPSTEQETEHIAEQETIFHSKYGTDTGTGNGTHSGTGTGTPPIPIPIPSPVKKKKAQALSLESLSDEVRLWVDWWNGLHERGLVRTGTRTSEANAKALAKAKANQELSEILSDRSKLETEIQASEFIQGGGWFTLAKLLSGKNKEGEFYAQRLIEGGYRGSKSKPTFAAGANYDPSREAGNGSF